MKPRLTAALCGALAVLALAFASPGFSLQERSLPDAPQQTAPQTAPQTAAPQVSTQAPQPAAQSPQAAPTPEAEMQAAPAAQTPPPAPPQDPEERKKYNRQEVQREVEGFFEGGSKGLAEIVSRPFDKYGKPNGFIKGNEGSGALIVGLRYGEGMLYLKGKKPIKIYWQSPSIGFDLGANASKVFTLVYNMDDPKQIFQRFPGVNGSAYIVGGFGMTYLQSGDIVLAPIRFGVGLRLGANVGYQVYTPEQSLNPF